MILWQFSPTARCIEGPSSFKLFIRLTSMDCFLRDVPSPWVYVQGTPELFEELSQPSYSSSGNKLLRQAVVPQSFVGGVGQIAITSPYYQFGSRQQYATTITCSSSIPYYSLAYHWMFVESIAGKTLLRYGGSHHTFFSHHGQIAMTSPYYQFGSYQ